MGFEILWEKNKLPSMIFYTEKYLFKIAYGQYFFVNQFTNFFAAHLRTN